MNGDFFAAGAKIIPNIIPIWFTPQFIGKFHENSLKCLSLIALC
jgi:hypothetical protein